MFTTERNCMLLFSGVRWSYAQMVMQKESLGLSNPLDMVFHVQPWMILCLLPFAITFEGGMIDLIILTLFFIFFLEVKNHYYTHEKLLVMKLKNGSQEFKPLTVVFLKYSLHYQVGFFSMNCWLKSKHTSIASTTIFPYFLLVKLCR